MDSSRSFLIGRHGAWVLDAAVHAAETAGTNFSDFASGCWLFAHYEGDLWVCHTLYYDYFYHTLAMRKCFI